MTLLNLSAEEVLTTTRAVRKRLDFDRPVPAELIRECVAVALQSPSGSNIITMHFVVITDVAKRKAVGEIYGQCFARYKSADFYAGKVDKGTPECNAQQQRVASSADYLGDHMGDAPALVIPCVPGRPLDKGGVIASASSLGNVLPAMWSFMLAARNRGLGTAWTTLHLMKEREVAEVVGIPFEQATQVCLSPLAYTKGTDFKPAVRPDPASFLHWNGW